jgi:hypothetical protein
MFFFLYKKKLEHPISWIFYFLFFPSSSSSIVAEKSEAKKLQKRGQSRPNSSKIQVKNPQAQ